MSPPADFFLRSSAFSRPRPRRYHIIYNELKVPPEEHPIMHTETALNPKAKREELAQVRFVLCLNCGIAPWKF